MIYLYQQTEKGELSSGGVWWKKIAEKRKEKCKLHSMAKAGNVKKQSLSHVYLQTGFKHIFINVTPSAKTEKHTQIKAHKRYKDTTSLRKRTTDDVSTNKFTG